ncbi:MAG TPA: GNAT family N-acetyltransferase [Planctomycetota bacterium]|nr:GNAT family N-acetyltransferase [Planctomycetota bacterium]
MSDIVVRDLRPEDVEAAVDIAVAAWAPIFGQFRRILGDELFAARCPRWQEDKAGQVRRACAPGSKASVCVAEREGRVVGFITYYLDVPRGIGEIGNNAVHPDFQGQGIASRMYQCVLDRFRAQGMRFAKVCTGLDPSHAPARRAYEKAGFSIQLPSVEYYRKL